MSEPLLKSDAANLPVAAAVPAAPLAVASAVPLGVPATVVEPLTMGRSVGQPGDLSGLAGAGGLVLRERIYLSQILCGACEKKASFAVGAFSPSMEDHGPGRGREAVYQNDLAIKTNIASAWQGEMREESTCLCRYCCHQFREMKMGFFPPESLGVVGGNWTEGGLGGWGWPEGRSPVLTLDRPFRCTLCCCCCLLNPQEMSADSQAAGRLGRTIQTWRWWMGLWPCMRTFDVRDAADKPVYTVQLPLACGDGCRNCCAPSCCNHVFSAPLLDAATGQRVGSIENHWPGIA